MSQVTHQAGAYPSFCSMKRETNKLRINLDLRWPYGITGIHWQGLSVIVHCRPIRNPLPPSPTPLQKILTCDLKFWQLLQLSSLSAQKCASTQLHMSCISLKTKSVSPIFTKMSQSVFFHKLYVSLTHVQVNHYRTAVQVWYKSFYWKIFLII